MPHPSRTAPEDNDDKFFAVTEIAGDDISGEQLERMCNRYYWARTYCEGKDVVEAACGSGQGLGYLKEISKSVVGFDISDEILAGPRAYYGERIQIIKADACDMPFEDASVDTLLLFEALYYIPDIPKFLDSTRRVLKQNGHLLIVTANKDLYDFNPSPHSHDYLGVAELHETLTANGFKISEMAGGTPVSKVSWKQKILRPIKKIVVGLNLMPKTMAGKKLLKRLVFGSMIKMPAEIDAQTCPFTPPTQISKTEADHAHKVIFCVAQKALTP
jgi:ubiquinone/menaquinone biosynthesis C-methylase UbiE